MEHAGLLQRLMAGAAFASCLCAFSNCTQSLGPEAATLSDVQLSKIEIDPPSVTVPPTGMVVFRAVGLDAALDTVAISVSWLTTGGSIDPNGIWTAPTVEGVYSIQAVTGNLNATAQGIVQDTAAPPPPPPPPTGDEPIFNAATDNEHFYDGFEAFTSSSQLCTYQSVHSRRWICVGPVELTTTGAFAGSKAARFIYPPSTQQTNALIETTDATPNADPSVIVLTWQMRTSPGYRWLGPSTPGGNTSKIMILNVGGGATAERIGIVFGSEPLTPTALQSCYGALSDLRPNISIPSNNYNQNMNDQMSLDGVANDGQWHRWTARITKSTNRPTTVTGDGRVEMWLDGVKIMEYVGDDPSRCEFGQVNVPTRRLIPNMHFPSVNSGNGSGADQWLEYDEVRVWSQ